MVVPIGKVFHVREYVIAVIIFSEEVLDSEGYLFSYLGLQSEVMTEDRVRDIFDQKGFFGLP